MSESVTSIARYRVKPEHVDDFLEVLDRHTAVLRELELVTDRDVEVYVGLERESKRPLVVEVFDWADEDASDRAHQHPAVSEVWEAMGPLCESREGGGPFDFANLQRVTG